MRSRRREWQYEMVIDFYFIRISKITDKMVNVFRNEMAKHKEKRSSRTGGGIRGPLPEGTNNLEPKVVEHDLEADDTRFLDTVVESDRISVSLQLSIEDYN